MTKNTKFNTALIEYLEHWIKTVKIFSELLRQGKELKETTEIEEIINVERNKMLKTNNFKSNKIFKAGLSIKNPFMKQTYYYFTQKRDNYSSSSNKPGFWVACGAYRAPASPFM